jgi:hypothetical protein
MGSTRITFQGDVGKARLMRPMAIQQLDILKTLMGFQNLAEDTRSVYFADGSVIQCHIFFDHNEVLVYVPSPPPPKPLEEEERPEWMYPYASFIERNGGKVYLFKKKGDPVLGTLEFYRKLQWGQADHVWFMLKARVPDPEGRLEYWALDGGFVSYNSRAFWTRRNTNAEYQCTGLPSGVTNYSLWMDGATYHMVVSFVTAGAEEIDHYTSSNGKAWTKDSDVTYSDGVQQLVGTAIPAAGGGWFRYVVADSDRDLFFLEHRVKESEPASYASEFFRIYRIGIKELWDSYGNQNTGESAWTLTADGTSLVQFTFEDENDFKVEGGHAGLQVLQVWD